MLGTIEDERRARLRVALLVLIPAADVGHLRCKRDVEVGGHPLPHLAVVLDAYEQVGG